MKSHYSELINLDAYYVKLSNEKSTRVINNTLEYYAKLAIRYKQYYFILSLLAIVLNAGIPVINQIGDTNKLIITLMSSMNLIITGIFSLLSIKETWSRYREACEKLKTECNKFNAKACPYSSSSIRLNEHLFLTNYEEITMAERKLWKMKGDMKGSNEVEQGIIDGEFNQTLYEMQKDEQKKDEQIICPIDDKKNNIQL